MKLPVDHDNNTLTVSFAPANGGDIMMEFSFQQFLFRGYVSTKDAEKLMSELMTAIREARKNVERSTNL